MDGDSGLRPVLGNRQRRDRRPHPLQRAGLCRRAQTGAEGEAGLNVCVWKAAGPRRKLDADLQLILAATQTSAPDLEPLLTGGRSPTALPV